MTPTAQASDLPTKEPSGKKWPVIIVSLLLLNVSVCAVTVTLSLRNPAQVTPAYYDKSLNWDEEREDAQKAAPETPPAQVDTTD